MTVTISHFDQDEITVYELNRTKAPIYEMNVNFRFKIILFISTYSYKLKKRRKG